jgi:glycosyltransferase 2 family protein
LDGASNVLGAVASAARKRVGWRALTGAVSLSIIAVAAIALYTLLRNIDVRGVIAAVRAQSPAALLLASGFAAAGYLMLTGYDVFALRAIGRKTIPYRVAALASFTSYTIGHSLGATVLTAGVVRYRVYAPWGLRVREIAAIAFITSLTYWLGTALVLGFGMVSVPEAISALDRLPAPANRSVGLAILTALAGYFVWLLSAPRRIGRSHWQIVIPGPRLMLVQMSIASLDLVFVGSAMYVLLPPQPALGFLHLLTVFAASMLVGVASHAPGSLGVLEAAMFLGLPQFKKEELLACLLTFRLIYFILPAGAAMLLLGGRELRKILSGVRVKQRVWPSLGGRK